MTNENLEKIEITKRVYLGFCFQSSWEFSDDHISVVLLGCAAHPDGDALARALHKCAAEGAVAAETALLCQLLGANGLTGSDGLVVETDEVVDAQVVDIGVIGNAVTREILAEVVTVGANGLSQLLQREVVLQVKLRSHTVLGQQLLDLVEVDRPTTLSLQTLLQPLPVREGSR